MQARLRLLLLAALVLGVPRASNALTISTDSTNRHQTIAGWGTSGGGSSAMAFNTWRNAYRDLGLNLYRIQLDHRVLTPERTDYNNNGVLESGETDYRVRVPLLGNTPEQNVAKFNFGLHNQELRSGSFANWLSENALEPERVKIVGSLWTPPHWMKGPTGATQNFVGITANYPTPWMSREHWNNGGVPKGQGDSIGGRLRTEDPTNLTEYGLYIASHVKAFEETFGVDLHAISLQNESTFENPFISAVLNRGVPDGTGQSPTDYSQYNLALKSVRDAWHQYGLDTKIKGPHVALNHLDPSNPWALLQQMNYINAVKADADPTLIDFLDYYNSNYYSPANESGAQATAGYFQGRDAVDANWAGWLPSSVATGLENDGKPIWFSETGYESNNWLQSPGNPGNGAINVAALMFNALVHGNASAYIYWQFTDGNNSNATEYSLVGSNQLSNPTQSAKYSSFKHFSRYVRPGAVRIDATFENDFATTGGNSEYDTTNSVNVSAFLQEEDQTLTYVLLNLTDSTEPVSIDLPEGMSFEGFQAFRSTQSERFQQLSDLSIENNQLSFSLPSYSLLTLIGEIVGLPGDFDGSGVVDGNDFLAWQRGLSPNPLSQDDLQLWQENFGRGEEMLMSQRVPEPSGSAMMLGALICSLLHYRPRLHETFASRLCRIIRSIACQGTLPTAVR